mgnify:CR=1 FL=1
MDKSTNSQSKSTDYYQTLTEKSPERNPSKSKKEKKPNLEGRFNKDDKKKTQGKAVKTDTLSIPTKDRTGKPKSENKVI